MEKIVNKTFKGQLVNVDFSEYEKCNFIGCMIHIEYGITRLSNCDLSDCNLSLGGPAMNIAKIIRLFFPDMPIWFKDQETKEDILQAMRERLKKENV